MATATEGIDPADLTDDQLEALENSEQGSTPGAGTDDDEQIQEGATAPEAVTTTTAGDTGTGAQEQQATTAAEDPPSKPAGIASKNGKHVLPFHVLQAERRRADEAARRADHLERELADLKAGKKPEEAAEELTEDEVVQMEQDFPEHGKKLRAVYEKALALEQKVGKSEPEDPRQAETSNPIQDAIDQIPMLLDWQVTDPEKFGRAQELDDVLKKSPKWKDKPLSDRFAHVARMVAEENDIPVDDEPSPKTSQATTRKDPKEVIANAIRTRPNTLSDFKGGATPDIQDGRIERLSPTAQVDRWADMSDDEIDAALAKSGG